ncbi:polysaccharide export outer membrane protein [Sphingobacterium allocomposti]|uniref:Polysaccharide export outer membrane protein n=1 Tax=Sphingobacterium allocomposti TaxID=415956 RepID=A0A5S5D728_9SPHI|nr:polysaccharide biosynthesis/export family protein [Sphingobacterium composti Yoo et al. 2007 non Ten et al. 2007]TYP91088.1 polysaccharide export outer membrane protein [Sphingobacterium composti Yoo et al. 2007 non Ten et al. 2007]
MKKLMKRQTFSRMGFFPLVLLLLVSSCSVKKSIYFNDLPLDSTRIFKQAAAFTEPVIQCDDILNITIQTLDPSTASLANQAADMQTTGAGSNQVISGFLVDKEGFVNMTLLGKVKLSGLTTYQAREKITGLAAQFYKDPTVQVRFANFKVTVLGEVARPASYTVPNEKITVLDALGLAGDLTVYGKRDNILLIRENGSEHRELVRLDLNRAETLSSPYFYLRQNDVIYVEPTKARGTVRSAPTVQAIGVITSVISVAVLAISRL